MPSSWRTALRDQPNPCFLDLGRSREETIAALAQESLYILDMLLVQLPLISGTLAVLVPLVFHRDGNVCEITQVGKTSNDLNIPRTFS